MIQNEVTQQIVQLNVLDILQYPTTTQVEVKSLFKFNGPLFLSLLVNQAGLLLQPSSNLAFLNVLTCGKKREKHGHKVRE